MLFSCLGGLDSIDDVGILSGLSSGPRLGSGGGRFTSSDSFAPARDGLNPAVSCVLPSSIGASGFTT